MDIDKDMKKRSKTGWLSGFTLVAALAAMPYDDASACHPDPYIGSICFTGAAFCPRGYYAAYGGILGIANDPALFSLVGDYWGGDGRTTFELLDSRGRELLHRGQGLGLSEVFWSWYLGSEFDYITDWKMPQHTHAVDLSAGLTARLKVSNAAADQVSPEGHYFAVTPTGAENYSGTAHTVMAASAVQAQLWGPATLITGETGAEPPSRSPVSRIGPQLGLLMCVAWDGQYPPRS